MRNTSIRGRVGRLLAVSVAVALVAVSCGDDDDVTTTGTGQEAATTTTDDTAVVPGEGSAAASDAASDATTGTAASPSYAFAVQPAPGFNPTAGVDPAGLGEEITFYLYPGQVVALEYIELDPSGDPCPTGASSIEVVDASGEVIATGEDAEVTIPEDARPGAAAITVHCERNGEPGVGMLEPVTIASLVEVSVTPATVAAGASVAVEVAGGCPAGFDGVAGLTPEDYDMGVFADPVPLEADGTADLGIPAALPSGTLYATVQCFDGEHLAVGFTPFDVSATPDG